MAFMVRSHLCGQVIKSLGSLRLQTFRCITTSKKNRDTTTAIGSTSVDEPICKDKVEKNWISYGFSEEDEFEDRVAMHSIFFVGITLCFVVGGFVLAYRPDHLGRDWAQREAFLELRRREKYNLPLVDPNYISSDKIKLPTDEELGDTEIII